jgi:uncharacterized spore protein YtfJ
LPWIQAQIGRFLSAHVIQEEFSHTVLHAGGGGGGGGRVGPVGPVVVPGSGVAERKIVDEKEAQARLQELRARKLAMVQEEKKKRQDEVHTPYTIMHCIPHHHPFCMYLYS